MVDSIKITALQDIGANIAYTTLVPVVNMAGTPTTQKSNLQNLGNLILNGAGGSYFARAAQANLALSVVNAAQPNITSVGTLSTLAVTGNITAGNINGGNIVVANFYYGDGGFLTNVAANGSYNNSNVANYLPTYTGNVGAGNVNVTGTVYANGLSSTGLASLTTLNVSTTANLGAVSNITITGGTNGQLLTTNGNGALSWTTIGGSSTISNGTSNVIVAANGNVSTSVAGVANMLVVTNTGIDVNGNISVDNVVSTSGNLNVTANGASWVFGQGGALYWPTAPGEQWVIEPNSDSEFEIKSTSNVVISTDISNVNSHFTFDTNGIFTAPSNVNLLGSRLNVGPEAANIANLASPTLIIANSAAEFIQAAIININSNGSADWIAQGADSDDAQGFSDLGFTGHSFNDPNFTITAPGDGYVFSQGYANGIGGSLVLATGENGNTTDIVFATGGFLANAEFARIDHANNVFHLTRANSGIQFADGSIQTTAGGSGSTGNVTFDDVTVQGVNELNLSAGPDYTANLAYLQVRAGDVASHIHFDTGNSEAYDLIVGNDQKFVQVSSTGNIIMSSYDGNTSYAMTLDTTGNLILAGGNSVIQSIANSSSEPLYPNVSTMVFTPDALLSSQSLVLDPTGPSHIHLRAPGANIDEPDANIFLGGEESSFEVGYYNGNVPNLYIHSGGNTWTFDTTGNLTLPLGSIVYETNIPDGALSGSAIALKPIGGTTANQQLLIYPTAADGDHIHMTSGNLYATELFLGSDNFYVKLANTGNVIINSNDGNSSNAMWTFSNDGTTTFPTGNITSNTSLQFTTTFANVKTVEYQTAGVWDLYVEDSITGSNTASSRLNVTFNDNLIDKPQVYIENTKESDGIALRWTFDENGNLNFPRDVAGNTDPYLTIVSGANPGITSTDASLAGPANLGISALTTTFTGFTGDAIKIYPDDGEISSTANLQIWANSGGNTEYSWTFDTTGNLTTPSNLVIGSGPGSGSSIFQYNEGLQILGEGANSVVQMGWTANTSAPDSVTTIAMNYPGGGEGNVLIAVGNNATTVNYWLFDNNGNLTIPGSSGGFIKTVANASIGIAAVDNGTNNPAQLLSMTNAGAATSIISAYATNATIQTNAAGAINTWAFDSAGNLTLPGNAVAIKFANGSAAFGNIATINLNGNTSQVLLGNGAFAAIPSSSIIANGNSNVSIASSNGNVVINAVGNTTMTVTGTGANVTGTLTSTGKIGYASGSTVTQTSNRGNGVNINALAGTIVTVSASMTAGEIGAFSVTNNQVDTNNDIILAQVVSPNLGNYNVIANPNSGVGGFYLTLQNISGFPISAEAVTIRFMVIKAPNA